MALSEKKVRAVRAMRAAEVPYRAIAEVLGISPSTVLRIVHGEGRHANAQPVDADADPEWPGKPFRCVGCGARIVDRCVACGLPPFRVAEAAGSMDGEELEELLGWPLGLDLAPDEESRYRPILARKQADPDILPADRFALLGEPDDGAGPTPDELRKIEGEIGPLGAVG